MKPFAHFFDITALLIGAAFLAALPFGIYGWWLILKMIVLREMP